MDNKITKTQVRTNLKTIVMKQLNLNNITYQYLEASFREWMEILGYAQSTAYSSGNYARDFFFYLKENGVGSLEKIRPQTIKNYHKHLQARKNKLKPGGLSDSYIASHISSLKLLGRYLRETGKAHLETDLVQKVDKLAKKDILTKAETLSLYRACGTDVQGLRDKALLGIYYGCGLRRSEGQALDIQDVLLKDKRIFVRKGKNYKERYVPINENIKQDLEDYIYQARQELLNPGNPSETALLLNKNGKRPTGTTLLNWLHQLSEKAKLPKNPGLHTLRHSIATHLLQSGLSLEDVSRFLGHSSLESTQIYTHVSETLFS